VKLSARIDPEMRTFTQAEIDAYTDENLFTVEVVISLLETVADTCEFNNYGPVKIEFWGKDKRLEVDNGIDVYFGYFDHLYRPKHIGIQIKVEKIIQGSSASLTNSIETIRNQVHKAYQYRFTSPLDNSTQTCKINGFYLITSKSVNQGARDFYSNDDQFTNLDIIDGGTLVHLIKKYSKEEERR